MQCIFCFAFFLVARSKDRGWCARQFFGSRLPGRRPSKKFIKCILNACDRVRLIHELIYELIQNFKCMHCIGAIYGAQYTYSRVYLPRFPTVFFQTSTPAIILVLRRACTVTLANDASGRGGGYHTPPPQGFCVGPVQTECKCTGLEA